MRGLPLESLSSQDRIESEAAEQGSEAEKSLKKLILQAFRTQDTHTSNFELGFSVRLNCHVGKEGEGTARRVSRRNSIVLKMFPKALKRT